MSEMIERVARAICRAGICGPKDHLVEQENVNWRKFVLEARAAIEAMREPTIEMALEGMEAFPHFSDTVSITRAYKHMINEALN